MSRDVVEPRLWGNMLFVDMAVGDMVRFAGSDVRLVGVDGIDCRVEVDGIEEMLRVARRWLPTVINGVRVFIADTRWLADSTTNKEHPLLHGAMTRDAMVVLSDPERSLVDPARFTFPISREDGYRWSMEEASHMFGYLGPDRMHEGVDLDMHDARGTTLWPLVAVEDAVVRRIDPHRTLSCLPGGDESIIVLESLAEPGIYYIYTHVSAHNTCVQVGETVMCGKRLAYIWGDGNWGHLHFAVVGYGEVPDHVNRYRNELNCFPFLYELYHGDLQPRDRVWTGGEWRLGHRYWTVRGKRRVNAWNPLVGYGWLTSPWNPLETLECTNHNVRLRRTLHAGTSAEAKNPQGYFDFEVGVPDGVYRIRVEVGDKKLDSSQSVYLEGIHAGDYTLAADEFAWTPETFVSVQDGRLTVRIVLGSGEAVAGVSQLRFSRIEPSPLRGAPSPEESDPREVDE